jgi:hypothetical protein
MRYCLGMPSTWGTEEKKLSTTGGYLLQFTKWFDLMGLDFEILRQAGRWNVTCWTRADMKFVATCSNQELDDAMLAVYSQVMKMRRSSGSPAPD